MEKNNQNSMFNQGGWRDKNFLQSVQWQNFQKNVGRRGFYLEDDGFSASIIEHQLPIVGKYWYCPRGPVFSAAAGSISSGIQEMVELAKKENTGWIRIDPENENTLELITENISEKVIKAPHDMQPKEIFVIDIAKNAEQLLAEMKPKTRYNIGIAIKRNVEISNSTLVTGEEKNKYADEFLRLTGEMAARQGIVAHPQQYYRKMIESLPQDMLKIYVAKYDGKIIAANLVLFFGETATYLHGASGNEHRNLMAPFLLQWQAMLDAKEKGCEKYDFGGVKTDSRDNSWAGITQFKLGFSVQTKPVEFCGSYDIIVNSRAYALYRGLQRAKAFAFKFRR